ncbi:ABC transporter TetB [Corynebacterium kutscheri]|uniref:ABC transporter ATP-binding protein n=1 Tax=Corynebacterium kutscheri TaxID=35755 RepID=UPI000F6F4A48|nr:ABC transporter ATP-binding protein [Corynebacterium kutscheri]VEH79638.1 ABC transporter TetB [Corynebacterium kutscheri]
MINGTDYSSDSLAPASLSSSIQFLKTLPHAATKKWWTGILFIFSLVIIATQIQSGAFGFAVDTLTGRSLPLIGTGTSALWTLIIIGSATLVFEIISRYIGEYLLGVKLHNLSIDLSRACLHSVLHAPVPEMMKLGTGNVITRMTKDINDAIRTLLLIGSRAILTVVVFPITFVSLLLIHPIFSLPLIVLGGGLFYCARPVLRLLPLATNSMSVAEAHRNSAVLDTLRGLPTLRVFSLGAWAIKRMEKKSWDSIQAHADRLPILLRLLGIAQFTYGLWMLSTIVLGIVLVASEQLSVGGASAAIFLVFRAEVQVFHALFFAGDIQNTATSIGRAVALAKLHQPSAHTDCVDLNAPVDVELKQINFSYPDGGKIINNLDITFAAGTTTAIVGASGAGKSTLAGLISGLQHPDSGQILIGGIDTNQVSDMWTARNVTLVSQEVHIFSGTLRDDLHFAAPHASDEQLLAVLAQVGLKPNTSDWVRAFPQGLATPVGAGAKDLSPEVQQQVALARVLLRNPQVVILDEATAEAASDSTDMLESAAKLVTHGRTAIVIAHRLVQAISADRIIVMDHGKIIEDGNHESLLALGGRYTQLFTRWSGSTAKS